MSGGHSHRNGKWCVWCGVTNGRISRAYVNGDPIPCVRPSTPCGHPLAARAVAGVPGDLVSFCWACRIETAPPWDNTGVGSSDESSTIANGARVLATTHDAGVIASRGSSS